MNFSFELSWALITGNINQDAMMGMGTVLWAIFGWIAIVRVIVMVAIAALMIISRWRIFEKAGIPGWGIFVPLYNIYLMFELGWFSGRWLLSILFPPLFIVMMIINTFNIAKRFWKHWTYGLGIIFLKVIFIPILAFDDAKYLGHNATKKAPVIHTPIHKTIEKKAPVKVVAKKAPAKKVKTLTKKK